MRFSAVLAAVAGASLASAQVALPSSIFGLSFSAPCQAAIISTIENSTFGECFPLGALLPILTMPNASIVPVLDMFMTDVCYRPACTDAALMMAASTILSGCASDLSGEGLSNNTVTAAFSTYPVVREVLCLKTMDPYMNTSYGGILGNPPIPVTSPIYNATNGTFCVTSLLTQLSAYFGTNISLSSIESVVMGENKTALGLVESISSTILCNDCIFAAVDIVEEAYPFVGSVNVSPALAYLNMTAPANLTLNTLLNSTCAYDGLNVTMNGTLPSNVTVSIVNSTFPFNVTG